LARQSLKESLGLRYIYQQQLTKFLMRFTRKTQGYFLNYKEMSAERTTLYSRLLPSTTVFSTFMESKLIYLNGHVLWDGNRGVSVNDLLQLMVSKWFYVYNRWLANYTVTRVRKFKYLVYRKGLARSHKLMKTRKQKSRYTPN